jgi:ABC-type hemin transport system substrate-binding protein
MAVLSAGKVPLLVVPDHHTGAGIVDKVRLVAEAVGAAGRGQCLARPNFSLCLT